MNRKHDDEEQAAYLREWSKKPKTGCSFLFVLALLPVLAAVML